MDPNAKPLETPPESRPEEEGAVVHPMDAFLEEEAYGMDSPRRGETRTGTIARISGNDILVDIGAKSEGVIPASEVEQMADEQRAEQEHPRAVIGGQGDVAAEEAARGECGLHSRSGL